MKRIATVFVEKCDDCPFFDNEYYDYAHTCTKLGREIPYSATGGGCEPPEDCPLPTA